jgi:hypothetical protein
MRFYTHTYSRTHIHTPTLTHIKLIRIERVIVSILLYIKETGFYAPPSDPSQRSFNLTFSLVTVDSTIST